MKNRIGWALAALGLFIVALLWQFPAAVITSRLSLPKGMQLGEVQGSVWQGQAATLSINGLRFEQLHWQFQPLALLHGKLAVTLHTRPGSSSLQGTFASSFGGQLSASNLTLRLPVAPLLAGVRLSVPSDIGGEALLAVSQFTAGQPLCQALNGKAQWLQASVSNRYGGFNLGRIEADLGCDKGAVDLAIHDDGALGLQLEARFDGRHYQVRGFAQPAASQPQAIKDALALFGKVNPNGQIAIEQQGRL